MSEKEWLAHLTRPELEHLYSFHVDELKQIHAILDKSNILSRRWDGLIYDVIQRISLVIEDYTSIKRHEEYGKELNDNVLVKLTNLHSCTESSGMVIAIGYDEAYQRYYMLQEDEVPKAINFCPWCGERLCKPQKKMLAFKEELRILK